MISEIKPIQKSPTDTVHILGNGESISLFDRSAWSDNNYFIGCNFSDPSLRPDLTIMLDARPIMRFYEGYKLSIPLVISNRCEDYIVKDQGGWDSLSQDAFVLAGIIKMHHDKSKDYPMNSGHHATLYAIDFNKDTIKEIHLWGFDTFWSNDLASRTDPLVKRTVEPRIRPSIANVWRLYWLKIFSEHPHIQFIIHGFNDKPLDNTFCSVPNLHTGTL